MTIRAKLTATFATLVAALALCAGLATPAFAEITSVTTNSGSSIMEVPFSKLAQVDGVTTMPDVTFKFKMEPYTGTIGENETVNGYPVKKGVGDGQEISLNTQTSAQMTISDATYTDPNDSTKTITAMKAVSVDNAAKFTLSTVGITQGTSGNLEARTVYRYQITETETGSSYGFEQREDTNYGTKYIVDLYTDDDKNVVAVVTYKIASTADTSQALNYSAADSAKMAVNFKNVKTEESGALKIIKDVRGNTSDVSDDEFTLSVTLSVPANNTSLSGYSKSTFTVSTYDKEGDGTAESSPSTIKVGEATTFTVKDGGYIVINNLPAGLQVSVTESAAVGYKATIYTQSGIATSFDGSSTSGWTQQVEGTLGSATTISNHSVIDQGTTIGIDNFNDTSTITGIVLNNLPFIIVAGVAVLGIVALILKRRRNAEED